MSMKPLEEYLDRQRQRIEASLDALLPASDSCPPLLVEAIRYSVFAGGKRLRPILLLAATEAVEGDPTAVLPAACALEYVHTYSMIHDDLPAMDNDAYRRGKLTNHKVYGEAMAILAGDALLTHAFEVMSSPALVAAFSPVVLAQATYRLARAAGSGGMVGGQVEDILSEGKQVGLETLEYIHRHKTAALIEAAVTMGAILGGAPPASVQALEQYGHCVGWAYQITDDILDVEGDATLLGKEVGRDAQLEKVTYPALLGVETSRQHATTLMHKGLSALTPLQAKAERLRQIAEYVVMRNV
jgi:geranylgeranyl diphosphate synthase type II